MEQKVQAVLGNGRETKLPGTGTVSLGKLELRNVIFAPVWNSVSSAYERLRGKDLPLALFTKKMKEPSLTNTKTSSSI